jgi:integrase
MWPTLAKTLPQSSFKTLTANMELPAVTGITRFEQMWEDHLGRRVALGEIRESTRDNYLSTSRTFFSYLIERKIHYLDKITAQMIEQYLIERKDCLAAKGGSGRGIITLQTILNAIFDLALREGVIRKNPIKYRLRPDSDPPPVNPFSSDELDALEGEAYGEMGLIFLLFRWTGMRGSDVAAVTWSSINWTDQTLRWKTKKRGRWVSIPLNEELYLRLVLEYESTNSEPDDRIISGATRAKLYTKMKKLGELAGVTDCHPHRFRATLVCDLLAAGASLFDVANLIGDTHAVVEKHYAAISDKQQDRVRKIIESAGQNPKRGGIVQMEVA